MDRILEIMRNNPAIPIFLTIGIGFWIGQLKYKTFSLGTVTSVLLVGVLVGQMEIPIPGPIKNVFFLLFLFAIGYSVGPQFFRALRGSGLKQRRWFRWAGVVRKGFLGQPQRIRLSQDRHSHTKDSRPIPHSLSCT